MLWLGCCNSIGCHYHSCLIYLCNIFYLFEDRVFDPDDTWILHCNQLLWSIWVIGSKEEDQISIAIFDPYIRTCIQTDIKLDRQQAMVKVRQKQKKYKNWQNWNTIKSLKENFSRSQWKYHTAKSAKTETCLKLNFFRFLAIFPVASQSQLIPNTPV